MEKLRMFFIDTIQNQIGKTVGSAHAWRNTKKALGGGLCIPRRAPCPREKLGARATRFSDFRILPDFRGESPVYAAPAGAGAFLTGFSKRGRLKKHTKFPN
jgi:hypothetical protein